MQKLHILWGCELLKLRFTQYGVKWLRRSPGSDLNPMIKIDLYVLCKVYWGHVALQDREA